MNKEVHISNYCRVKDSCLWINGHLAHKSDVSLSLHVFLKELYTKYEVNYPKFFKMDNLCKLGFIAAEILIKNERDFIDNKPDDTGIFLSNSYSSLDTDIKYNDTIKRESYFPSPALFVYTLPNIVIGEIAIRHKITGECNFFVSEKPDSEFIFHYLMDYFDKNLMKNAITGWVDVYKNNYEATLFYVKKTNKTNESIIFEPDFLNK